MIRKLITLLLITIIHSSVHLAFAQEYTPASTTTESTGDYSVRGKVVDADGGTGDICNVPHISNERHD